MAFSTKQLRAAIPCPCGRWEWREIPTMGAVGCLAVHRVCPKCTRDGRGGDYYLVLRVSAGARGVQVRLLDVVHVTHLSEVDLRNALGRVPGLDDDERELLVTVATLVADLKPMRRPAA